MLIFFFQYLFNFFITTCIRECGRLHLFYINVSVKQRRPGQGFGGGRVTGLKPCDTTPSILGFKHKLGLCFLWFFYLQFIGRDVVQKILNRRRLYEVWERTLWN
jgi:hypothetical protein